MRCLRRVARQELNAAREDVRAVDRRGDQRACGGLDARVSILTQPSNTSRRLYAIACSAAGREQGAGWLTAGPFRIPCALGPAGIVRIKREGDTGTPAGRFRLLWGYYRPDRVRLRATGAPLKPLRRDQGWCEAPSSPRYNRPVRLPADDCTDRMWREDHLYDVTFVLDQNFSRRAKGRGSAIFFHLARAGFTPTAGCVAISRRRHAKARSAPRAPCGHGDRLDAPLTTESTRAGPFLMIASPTPLRITL